MGYSFEDIEHQAQATHAQAQSVLGNTSKSVLAQHKKAFAVLAISATVLGASFILPSSEVFKADLTNPFDTSASSTGSPTATSPSAVSTVPTSTSAEAVVGVQTNAQDVTVTPLVASVATTDTTTNAASNPFLSETQNNPNTPSNITVTDNTNTPAAVVSPTPTISTTEATPINTPTEVNPFLSLLDNPSTPTPTTPSSGTTESLHGSAFDLFGSSEKASETPSSFKENTHTDGSVAPASDGVAFDPAQWTAVSDINNNVVPQQATGNRFTGILAKKKSVAGFPFSYYLELDDGSKLQINTQRDLRSVYGKEITIEIDGTRDNFTLTHVYYDAKNQKLPQSGPATSLALVTLLAGFGAWILRRKTV